MTLFEMPIAPNQIEFVTQTHWDAIVVGGGMVGALTALGLAKNNFNVLMLERNAPELTWSENTPYQTRVSALTRASESILRSVDAWKGIETRRYHPFVAMQIWETQTSGQVQFKAEDIQEPNLGFIVENQVVQAAIWDELMLIPNVTCMTGAKIAQLTSTPSKAILTLEEVGEISTSLIVGADGAHSQVRALSNIGLDTHDYEQCAVVGCVRTEKSHQDTCWQRYQADGPFAFLPMDDNVSSIAWYLPTHKMNWALSLNDEEFIKALNKASGERLGSVVQVSHRAAFPLVRRHATEYVKPHIVLVGDAAHTIHPQAGQGVNLGLLDAASLVATLVKAKEMWPHKDWSRLSVLRRYERSRRGDNAITQKSMEWFDRLFKQDAVLKTEFRKVFLPLANGVLPVKNWLMSQALYGRNSLPELIKYKAKQVVKKVS